MQLLKSQLRIDRQARSPVYLQLANQLIHLVQSGLLRPGDKLPGTRKLAKDLDVHRQTIVHCLEELEAQGWIEIQDRRGAFISQQLPQLKRRPLGKQSLSTSPPQSGFAMRSFPHLSPPYQYNYPMAFDDGAPDTRLAPVEELARAYARNLRRFNTRQYLGYTEARGNLRLRRILADELGSTRALHPSPEQIMITRGSQMGIYLTAAAILRPGDRIVVGQSNYFTANMLFQHLDAQLCKVRVDQHGLVVDDIDLLCQQQDIRAVYVTSHHHHPTTVTLPPERRLQLLELAKQHRFAIIEDDYDYEFHYDNSPLLPLASADRDGLVVYIGSFSKSIAPAFRTGYIVAPSPFIDQLCCLRRIIDRQGDPIQELALADLIEEGVLRRHLKKALKQYRKRRDCFAKLLREELSEHVQFQLPSGGMALWAQFDPAINLTDLSRRALAKGLYFSDGALYRTANNSVNGSRMGFASMNEQEIERAVLTLKSLLI
ncbi:MAG: PLP-dependent aminotransferase family protein [Bacteroidota bacterium]